MMLARPYFSIPVTEYVFSLYRILVISYYKNKLFSQVYVFTF